MPSELISRLRNDLTAAAFTVSQLSRAWGEASGAALFRGERIAARRALDLRAGASPAELASCVLAKLFILGYPQPLDDVANALPSLGIEGAERLALVQVDGGTVLPRVDLRPYSFVDSLGEASWWVASDLGEIALAGPLPENHVLGIGGASTTLSGLMVPRAVDRALDIGTGCGIQALHATRHARQVVATDISARALEFGRFNAALNQIDGIEWRLGSLFEPVAGETFDLVVSNPPSVITPRVEGVPTYEYRDGGMVGDALVATVIRQAGAHLTPGGIAQFLGNWETGSGSKRGAYSVSDWVRSGAVPLDVWVVEREVQDTTSYAETWIRDGGTRPGTPSFDLLYEAWLDDFAARGVTEVGFGYVTLRRPQDASAHPTTRIERLAGALGSNGAGLGAHLLACLDADERLRQMSDDELSACALVVAGDVTEERHYWPGNDDPTVITLRQGGGFARSIDSGTALSALVGACDGDLTVGPIVAALAQLLKVNESDLRLELLPRVRELVHDGLLRL